MTPTARTHAIAEITAAAALDDLLAAERAFWASTGTARRYYGSLAVALRRDFERARNRSREAWGAVMREHRAAGFRRAA